MGLAERQRVIALLSTDHALRERFQLDPRGVAQALGLGVSDCRALADLDFQALDGFGRSLWLKRCSEVEVLLPLTVRALGPERWRRLFHQHARLYRPMGIHKPIGDAIGFASWLFESASSRIDAYHGPDPESPRPPTWIVELACFEAGFLRSRDRLILCERFRHRVIQIARSLAVGDQPAAELLKRSRWPAWVFWVRLVRDQSPRVWVIPR